MKITALLAAILSLPLMGQTAGTNTPPASTTTYQVDTTTNTLLIQSLGRHESIPQYKKRVRRDPANRFAYHDEASTVFV